MCRHMLVFRVQIVFAISRSGLRVEGFAGLRLLGFRVVRVDSALRVFRVLGLRVFIFSLGLGCLGFFLGYTLLKV